MNPARVLRILRLIEWEGDSVHWQCPECGCCRQHGHYQGCELEQVLQALEQEEQQAAEQKALITLSEAENASIEEEETIG